MTTGAYIILIPTWGLITYYTIRYFYLVLMAPIKKEE
jgi:hypothetical protein